MRGDSGLLLAAYVAAAAASLVASASSAYRVVGDVRVRVPWVDPTSAAPGAGALPTDEARLVLDVGLLLRVAALVAVMVLMVAFVRWVRRHAASVPTPPAGVLPWTVLGLAILLAATTGSEWGTIGALAAAVIALAWLHVLLTALVDPLPPRAPYARPATLTVASAARVRSLSAELGRALGRPQYDGSVRPRLAELARERLERHGVDPDTAAGRVAAVTHLGAANCDYLFHADGPGVRLDQARLDALLTALEKL